MSTKSISLVDTALARPLRAADWLIGVLVFLTLAGVVAGVGRLGMGLQASTGLNDTYSWGIWIGFDFGLIAFAGVGFTMAAVVHVLHMERFHAAVKPAILAGLMGYMAVLALLVLDLGRWDRFYHFILYWNVHSPLFEISWCVLLYSTVLMIEVSPDFLGRLKWRWPLQLVKKIMLPVCIVGVTLSTLHQSTLGTLYLNMPHRLHPLWYTPFLPVLFYVSSIMAGLSLAIVAYKVAMVVRQEPEDRRIAMGLGTGVVVVAIIYAASKIGEVLWAGEWQLLFDGSGMGLLWVTELALGAALPVLLWSVPRLRSQAWVQWTVPLLVLASVLMNRFNATLYAQVLPPGLQSYTPSLLEWLSTIGILAGAALAWLLAVRFVMKKDAH